MPEGNSKHVGIGQFVEKDANKLIRKTLCQKYDIGQEKKSA